MTLGNTLLESNSCFSFYYSNFSIVVLFVLFVLLLTVLSYIFRCTCIAGERTALHAGSASSTGNAALDEIIKRLSMDEGGLNTMNNNKTHYVPQVMVFPEGTCGNSNVLFRFNKGPFSLGKPVQMACFQYPYRYVDDDRARTKLQHVFLVFVFKCSAGT